MRSRLYVLCLMTLCFLLPGMAVSEEKPELVLTYVPVYGEDAAFEGFVQGCADPTGYRITMYIQVLHDGEMWVKPSAAVSYVVPEKNGIFALDYSQVGTDRLAVTVHLLLIPEDFTPALHDFAGARAVSFDYVCVTRDTEGRVAVSPDRFYPGRGLNYTPKADRLIVDVGFYTDGGLPGQGLRQEQITRQLDAVRDFADGIRLYGASGEIAPAYQLAHDRGFETVFGTAYLSGNPTEDQAQLDALIEHCQKGLVSVAIVGNETLLSNRLTEEELLRDIQYVRERVDVPVTTSDSIEILLSHPVLCNACDILMPNIHAFWNAVPADAAAGFLAGKYQGLRHKARGKQIIISETGYPSDGQTVGGAVPGEAAAAAVFEASWQWAMQSGVIVCWFDAADEGFKAAEEGEAGAHWGFMTSSLMLKPGYARTAFFEQIESDIIPKTVSFVEDGKTRFDLYTDADRTLVLPDCPFESPAGMCFRGWEIGGRLAAPGTTLLFGKDTTVHAFWAPETICLVTADAVEKEAFQDTAVVRVILGEACKRVGDGAFSQCRQLQVMEMHAGVTSIGENVFDDSAPVTVVAPADSFPIDWAREHKVPYLME